MFEPSKEQESAINSFEKKNCIIACAGSGKTFTLTRKIAKLIDEYKADPSNIVAITFTVMAANNLKIELSKTLKNRSDVPKLFVGTIHAYCYHQLNKFNDEVVTDYQVISENQQYVLLNQFWAPWEIEAIDKTKSKSRLIESLISSFNIIKMENIDPKELQKRHPELYDVFIKYNEFLASNNYLDFADLINRLLIQLETDADFKNRLLGELEYLFIDEYQDVDPAQARIFELLNEKAAVTVVGDDDQAIYQFRGTDVENILNFSKSADCSTKILSVNRRCPKNILTLAENTIKKVNSRYNKIMSPDVPHGKVNIIQFDNLENEIAYITGEILRLKNDNEIESFGDVAILMRSVSSYGHDYIESLKESNIPYIVKGARNLFDTDEIENIVSVLEWIIRDPNTVSNLSMVSNLFKGQLNHENIKDAQKEIEELKIEDAQKIGLTKEDYTILAELIQTRERYRQKKFGSLLEIVHDVFSTLKILDENNPEGVLYNAAQFSQIVGEYELIIQNKKLPYLCGFLRSYAQRSYDEAMPIEAAKNSVNILTIHQSKGLEFDYVFLPMLVEKRFPVSKQSKRWIIDDSLFDSGRYYNDLDDERRLFYVSSTRAKRGLHLLCSKNVGLVNPKKSSIFFSEAKKVVLPEKNIVPNITRKILEEEKFLTSSFSALEYYLTCPYRYKILVVYGLATPPNPFFEFGRLIHHILGFINNSYALELQLSFEQIKEEYEKQFDMLFRNANLPHLEIAKQKIRGLKPVKTYFENKGAWYRNTEFVEKDFEFISEKSLIKGRYDFIYRSSKDKAVIVDFKTGQYHDYLRTDFQMQLYSLAALLQEKIPVEKAILYYVEKDKEISYDVNEDFLKEGQKKLNYVVDGILSEKFHATPGRMCSRCEVRRFCNYRQ